MEKPEERDACDGCGTKESLTGESPALGGAVPALTSHVSSPCTTSDKLPSSWGWQGGCCGSSAHPKIWP